MEVMFIENKYDSEKLFDNVNFISHIKINSVIKNLEEKGYGIKGVQLINYEYSKIERVMICYE